MKLKKVISVLSTSFLMANITNLSLVNATGGEKGKLGYNELAIINRYKAMGTDEKFSMISKRCAKVCSNSPADFAYDFLNIFAEAADLNQKNNGINSFRIFPLRYNYNDNLLEFLINCNVDMFEHIDIYKVFYKCVDTVEEFNSTYLEDSKKFTNDIKDILLEFMEKFPSDDEDLISYDELCNIVLRLCSYSEKGESYVNFKLRGDNQNRRKGYYFELKLVFPRNCKLVSPRYTEKDKYILDAIKYLYYKMEHQPTSTESGRIMMIDSYHSIVDYVRNGLNENTINHLTKEFFSAQRERVAYNIKNLKLYSHFNFKKD